MLNSSVAEGDLAREEQATRKNTVSQAVIPSTHLTSAGGSKPVPEKAETSVLTPSEPPEVVEDAAVLTNTLASPSRAPPPTRGRGGAGDDDGDASDSSSSDDDDGDDDHRGVRRRARAERTEFAADIAAALQVIECNEISEIARKEEKTLETEIKRQLNQALPLSGVQRLGDRAGGGPTYLCA